MLGVEILLDGHDGTASPIFELQAGFEMLETLLDTPAPLVERDKIGLRNSWIEQGRNQNELFATGQNIFHHTHGNRVGIGTGRTQFGLNRLAGFQRHDSIPCRTAGEFTDLLPTFGIDTGTEGDTPLKQPAQPSERGEAAIKQQEMIRGQMIPKPLGQGALILGIRADYGIVDKTGGHLIEHGRASQAPETSGGSGKPAEMLAQSRQRGHAERGTIDGHNPQAVPSRNGHVGVAHQFMQKRAQRLRAKGKTRLGDSAFGDLSGVVCFQRESKKAVEFGLQAATDEIEKECDKFGEGELALTGKGALGGASQFGKLLGLKKITQAGKDAGTVIAKTF